MTRSRNGFTLMESLISIVFLATAIVTSVAVISGDISLTVRNRVDLIGQTALRKRVEVRRLQKYTDIFNSADPDGAGPLPPGVPVGPCRDFTNDPGYDALRTLPFGQGQECAEDFEKNGRLRRLTVLTKVFDRPTGANDPNLRTFRTTFYVYADGINQQPGE